MKNLLRALGLLLSTLVAVLTAQAQPANDDFADAWTLTGAVVTTNGNSGQVNQGIPNATKEPGEPNHAGFPGGRSVWFKWTPTTNATVRIDTIGSGFNTLLAVYTGEAVNALTLVAENNDVGGGGQQGTRSRVEFPATLGTTYHIAIDGRAGFTGQNPASGPYVLNLRTLASVFITSPTNGSVILAGTPMMIDVSASVPDGSVTRVDFYRAETFIGSVTNEPYSLVAPNSPPGTNRLFAVAVDSGGLSWTSAVVNVAVLSIGVTVVTPAFATVFPNNNPIAVSAIGLLPSGSITNVEFLVDGEKFGEDGAAPFNAVWSTVTGGPHRLSAIGHSDSGATYNSLPVSIAVAQLLVPSGSVWQFLDNGSDQGTAWAQPEFDASSWSSGPAQLGYGDNDEATVVSFGPDPNNKYVTTYFRHAFAVTNAASYEELLINVQRDDGAVVHLNGVETARYNMPGGVITFTTLANNAADDGQGFFPSTAPGSLLVEGTNVLAVEIHQTALNSSDISFDLEMIGVPRILRNAPPLVALTQPTNNAAFLAPSTLEIEAMASDIDGSVALVEFFVDDVKLGEDGEDPYSFTWNLPAQGDHILTAVATDDLGATAVSAPVALAVYDAVGTPLARITSPLDGAVMEGPTNLLVTATAHALAGVTNVEFLANGVSFGDDATAPYSAVWSSSFGSNRLTAVTYDANGVAGTSAVVAVTITIPPTNTVPPTVARQVPAADATITNLSTIQVTFTERVQGVDAADLLVNGLPADAVTGSGSNYTFTVETQPALGTVTVTWAPDHGITDFGYPRDLPFDEADPGAHWTYNLVDRTPPVIAAQDPPAGAVVTNLTRISVAFSEAVSGVDAGDFLINGEPAVGLSGGGPSYTFTFPQPAAGSVSITWAPGHGIADFAASPNPFNATGPGATWSYTLDNRTVLVQSNSFWLFVKGFAEASTPIGAWRELDFDDSSWSNAPAPFYYGDPYGSAANPGTLLSDMQGGAYSSVYLRQKFVVQGAAGISNLFLNAQSDDGFIAWINGVEVLRYNMGPGEIPYNGSAPTAINEPNNSGAAYLLYTLNNAGALLAEGENVLAVQGFNNQPQTSSDFGFNAQLYTYVVDPRFVPPVIAGVNPRPDSVFFLTNITVRFSEAVSGVDAGDLLVNGVAATQVSSTTNTTYTFGFAQPPFGTVLITWSDSHGIQDADEPPKAFDETGGGASFRYTLLNPSAPTVGSQVPLAGATVNSLTEISVSFSEAVTGVDAADLLVAGAPAASVSGGPANYTFSFAQPPFGPVAIGWAANHGIADLEVPANPFDPSRPGSVWSYTLVDQTPPVIASHDPPDGASVTNLTSILVTFSEPVTGVDAGDLLINGAPASGVSGGPVTFAFTFPQPNATLVNVTWANGHGIRDLAAAPNPFDGAGPGATWSYSTPDTVAPALAGIDPPSGVTVRSLTSIRVVFSEAVAGVGTNDLLINDVPARSVSGSGAGPYTFAFLQPAVGPIEVRWAIGHGITDLAEPPNAFAGGEWTYLLDPNADFAGQVLINEIMFNPLGGATTDEWIELRNISSDLINLTGWRLTRGVNFTFPNVAIPAGGYLVVAADLAAFQAKHPGVTNAVGGWTGQLANSDETIELETALGESVNRVHFATEGDWARRERGHGAQPVTGVTLAGSTATFTVFGHGFTGNDRVMISGADQPAYNGIFTIANVQPSTFNVNVPGASGPPTGNLIARHVIDDGASGWSWFSAADGFGSSLELVNPALPGDTGQNWLSSTNENGTPGRANSASSTNSAPLVLEVVHVPAIPTSTDPVAITARVRDELSNGVASVTLFYRNHTTTSPGAFSSAPMLDDGGHSDGVAGDGLFGAVLPPSPNRSVVEFYVQATDTTGRMRTWPAPTWETNNSFAQLANAYYQVDNETIGTQMPALRLVLSGTENATFPPNNRNSDAEMNATLISVDGEGTKIRYNCGVRVRGAGTRTRNPPNNRLNIPNDHRWNGLQAINLNSQFVHAQLVGNVLAQKSGLLAADAHVIQYRINGVNPAPPTTPSGGNGAGWSTFLLIQPVNGDLAGNLLPQDGDGNVYRASSGGHQADLNYSSDLNSYLNRGYYKTANQTENDWTDLQSLTFAFSQVGPDADYFQAIRTNVNVLQWMRYFAVGSLMNFGETSLFNGIGDDYALYRGELDRRFQLIGHDFDTIFGQGDTGPTYYPINTNSSIYIMLNPPNTGGSGQAPNVPVLRRFMTEPNFAPFFYAELQRLADTVFNPAQLNPLLDQLLTGWGVGPDANTIASMKTYAANRRANALAQIPLELTVNSTLPTQNGFPFTTTPSVTLFGSSHAIQTRQVLVHGTAADWSAWEARWTNTVALRPGLNRVLVQSLDSNQVEFARATLDIWYDDGSVQPVSGAIGSDTVWSAAAGPYQVTANLTVNAGATLTIQPGTTVYLGAGVNLTVANGGRILAEGTETDGIRFTRVPGGANWGGLTINGGVGSPESRFAHVHFENNNSTALHAANADVFLDHLTFGNTAAQYVSLDGSSFVVQDCVFPSATAQFELVHGTQGIKAGGRGLFLRNFFGKAIGYNDVVDFTGGNRPGPIVQFFDNVFIGTDDDILDLDSTDAWIEGNIFLHCHRNGSPDSASGVSGGADNADTSEITVVGNLFYDVDQVANAKQGNFYTLINNTVVHQTRTGSQDTNAAVVILADDGTVEGAGIYLEGNILFDIENLVRNRTAAIVTFTNNLMPLPWSGPGGNNVNADPLFKYVPQFSETTNFTSFEAAQVLWDWFSLLPGSPALGTGPNGRDLGVPLQRFDASTVRPIFGASLSGEPLSPTPLNHATLVVGVNRTGNGIPSAGFPNGSGFTHYRWRIDRGVWSAETPVATPITLNNLASGPHFVEVSGRNDAGFYQDDPVFGPSAALAVSRTWTVDPNASPLRLNEVLAANAGALNHNGTTPDAIELYNAGDVALDLGGLRLTDDQQSPDKFIFPAGASIPARGYLVLFANDPDGTPGVHLGFNLNQQGEAVYLFDAAANGGALLDSVVFGLQLTDLSIGRIADGSWALTVPTFGAANQAAPTGDPDGLRLNEWLALGVTPFANDFIELYNADPRPVALGGLYLSDETIGWPDRHRIAALSFIPGHGYLRFFADGNADEGADHLNFSLSPEQGSIGLYLPDLTPIDCVAYQPQRLNESQGRSPNGGSAIVFFDTPTPGGPNPLVTGPPPNGGLLVINEVLANNAGLVEGGRTPDWLELYNGTTNRLDLGDLSVTDDTLQPRRFVFAPGTGIAPGGFLRIVCDPRATNGGPLVNTNFALKSSGGGVYLFDAPAGGGSLLNSIVYGLQTPDLSIGRVPDGGTNWVLTSPTPATANAAVPALGSPANLRVNEWLADPAPGDDDWFEVFNPNPLPVALGGLWLTDDLNAYAKHRIAPLSFLGLGTNAWQKFVADGNTGAGADHVSFSLRAAGEALGIFTDGGSLLDGIAFGQQQPEVSEGRFPDGSPNVVAFPGTASPGRSNWRRLAEVVISEALTHTDLPLEDAVELQNLTDSDIDVGGWWLSDDDSGLQKYQIPSPTVLPPYGFTVIYETAFSNAVTAAFPFALSSLGDEIVLSASSNGALTGYRARVDFGAQLNGVSFGRYLTSDNRAEFVAMSARTFGVDDPSSVEDFRQGTGASNAYPRVGPVVISEVMYHPPDLGTNDNVADEFVELRNITTAPVPLYDVDFPANRWRLRGAVDFDFPADTVIAPADYLLVVSFDPVNNTSALAAFRARYNIPPGTAIVGPYAGKLANDTDNIELRRPDTPNPEGVPYALVERVRYFDAAPWPAEADGTGFSLQRISETAFGNDPANWTAGSPTPGPQGSSGDTDGDGMPDSWETVNGFDPLNPNDAGLDSDGDGLTNLQEYQAGTLPRDAQSVLRLTSIAMAPGGTNMQFTFLAASNQAYSVLWKESLSAGKWTKLADVAGQPFDRVETVIDPLPLAYGRLYRVVTPQQPGPVNPMPAILSSPKATIAEVGSAATFEVIAVGQGPLSYQWLSNGIAIPNATDARLTLSNVQFADVGLYSVAVEDTSASDQSGEVYLAVPPRVLVQPQAQQAPAGGTVMFSVTAEGIGPLSYRWRRNSRPIPGQTNATLVLAGLQASDAGEYSVTVAHQLPWGRFAAVSSNAALIVEAPAIDYVVHMTLDGLGGTYLQFYVNDAPAQFPNFTRLMSEGAFTFNARCDYDVSETIPNHASVLTGRPVLQPAGFPDITHHGYNNNFPGGSDTFHLSGNPNVPYKSSFFDVAHDHGLTTAFYASKTRLLICDRSYDAVNGAPDLLAPDHGRDKIDFASVVDLSGPAISNEMNGVIADLTGTSPKNYSFVHLAEPDLTGHASGWGSAAWSNSVRLVDQQLGRVLEAITTNPVLAGRAALIVTADHGGGGVNRNGHTESYHPTNYTIPFFLWGPGIPAGTDLYQLLANRADPGTNRLDYTANPQPLRDGDSGNLALALLGLPPIPGSLLIPDLSVATAPRDANPVGTRLSSMSALTASLPPGTASQTTAAAALRLNSIQLLPGNQVGISVSVPANQPATIEFKTDLSSSSWVTLTNLPPAPLDRVLEVLSPPPGSNGFYRLRSP